MTALEDTRKRSAQLRDEARIIRSRAQDARARARVLAGAAAVTENQIAVTSEHLARQQPSRQRLVPPQDGGNAARRGAGVAASLQDAVVRELFAAGLSLQSAAGLTADPEVLFRIESAVTALEKVIRDVRNEAYRDAQQSHDPAARSDVLRFTGQLATTARVRIGVPARDSGAIATDTRLQMVLELMLSLIGEYATPTSVDVTANVKSYSLAIEAVPLAPGASAGECARWLRDVHARAARNGVGVAIQPVPGGTRFTWEMPAGLRPGPGTSASGLPGPAVS